MLVFGDYIRDIYIYGTVDRISPESPIPVFVEDYQEARPGGVGNVIANLQALGTTPVSFYDLNSVKKRFVCDNHILFRSDIESNTTKLSNILEYDIHLKNSIEKHTYAIISDYNKGFIDQPLELIDLLKRYNIKVVVDPKKPIENYKGADIVKLNLKELNTFCTLPEYDSIVDILTKNNIGALVVTMGAEGAVIHTVDKTIEIKAERHQVSDVTGAGDIFIAVLTHFLSKGNNLEQACKKAVKLSSISVTKFGTYTLQQEDIKKAYTVFTNGCFDILHKGHIEYLKQSKQLGDKLIVGLNSDQSVKMLKGEDRPINNQQDRKAVLEALDCVDEVIIFDEETPYNLIKSLQPDIITKGGDYIVDTVIGNDLAEVIIIPYIEGYSTSKVLRKLNG